MLRKDKGLIIQVRRKGSRTDILSAVYYVPISNGNFPRNPTKVSFYLNFKYYRNEKMKRFWMLPEAVYENKCWGG